MRKTAWTIISFIIVVTIGYVVVKYYPYIFSRNVEGVVVSVEKPVVPTALVGVGAGTQAAATTLFSYAVAIREQSGEIVTASTEDRQWAVAQIGKCATAKYYPYPPWDFDKAGTYYNARLLKLHDCPSEFRGGAPQEPVPQPQIEQSSGSSTPGTLPADTAPADAPIQVE